VQEATGLFCPHLEQVLTRRSGFRELPPAAASRLQMSRADRFRLRSFGLSWRLPELLFSVAAHTSGSPSVRILVGKRRERLHGLMNDLS